MFNNKFWLIMAITLFSVLCCLGSQEEVKIQKTVDNSLMLTTEDNLKTLTEEDVKKCPWDENTIFHKNRKDVDYTIPCAIYDKAVEQGKEEYATLMVAISIWETGWYTSYAFTDKNNFGGMRGSDGWMYFESQEAGANAFVNMISKYYIDQGLDDAYKMQSKYASGSKTWANNVLAIDKLLKEI